MHIGNVNDKITLENVTILEVGCYETQYGVTHIFKITDENGNAFTWRTNKNQVENKEGKYVPIESYTNIKGTIKAHTEYNGEKQTELTRCKIIANTKD